MAVTINTDSYITVAEADLYFLNKVNADVWDALDPAMKEKLLISGAQQLDIMCLWNGKKISSTQAMEFPRTHADPVPVSIKNAQAEIALIMSNQGSSSGASAGGGDPLTELKAGSVTLKFDTSKASTTKSNPYATPLISRWLSAYGSCAFGTTRLIPMELQ